MRLANNENSLVEITKVTKTVTKSNVGRIVRFKGYRGLTPAISSIMPVLAAEGNVGLVYKESPRYGPLANQGKGGLLYLICNGIEPLTGYFPPENVNSILEWLDED